MDATSMKFIAIGIMAIAMGAAAIGVSLVFSSGLNGISRNPQAESKIGKYIYVGAGLCESIGLFALVAIFLMLFVIK
ncbi:ATP synthase subunit c family protein [Candidatus Deianiraea vastatrix]|nr:F0F1 ATP synthase subunit C [Candidatus Deianiraea vastatrix]